MARGLGIWLVRRRGSGASRGTLCIAWYLISQYAGRGCPSRLRCPTYLGMATSGQASATSRGPLQQQGTFIRSRASTAGSFAGTWSATRSPILHLASRFLAASLSRCTRCSLICSKPRKHRRPLSLSPSEWPWSAMDLGAYFHAAASLISDCEAFGLVGAERHSASTSSSDCEASWLRL